MFFLGLFPPLGRSLECRGMLNSFGTKNANDIIKFHFVQLSRKKSSLDANLLFIFESSLDIFFDRKLGEHVIVSRKRRR